MNITPEEFAVLFVYANQYLVETAPEVNEAVMIETLSEYMDHFGLAVDSNQFLDDMMMCSTLAGIGPGGQMQCAVSRHENRRAQNMAAMTYWLNQRVPVDVVRLMNRPAEAQINPWPDLSLSMQELIARDPANRIRQDLDTLRGSAAAGLTYVLMRAAGKDSDTAMRWARMAESAAAMFAAGMGAARMMRGGGRRGAASAAGVGRPRLRVAPSRLRQAVDNLLAGNRAGNPARGRGSPGLGLESLGAQLPARRTFTDPFSGERSPISATARAERAVRRTSIRADLGESEAYKAALRRGEIGLQRPLGANEGGPDFITAVRGPRGQIEVVVTDAKTGRPDFRRRGSLPPAWRNEVADAVSEQRLRFPVAAGDTLAAEIRAAFRQGRVRLRYLHVDWPQQGSGEPAVTGW